MKLTVAEMMVLGYGVLSGDGALKSELGHIFKEESQDLLVRCEMR